MTKRKSMTWTGREPEEKKEKEERPRAPVIKAPMVVNLRSLWHTRLVIGPPHTLTGKRYVFDPGEVKSVPAVDAERLLVMEKKRRPGCCGSEPSPPVRKYFEVA